MTHYAQYPRRHNGTVPEETLEEFLQGFREPFVTSTDGHYETSTREIADHTDSMRIDHTDSKRIPTADCVRTVRDDDRFRDHVDIDRS